MWASMTISDSIYDMGGGRWGPRQYFFRRPRTPQLQPCKYTCLSTRHMMNKIFQCVYQKCTCCAWFLLLFYHLLPYKGYKCVGGVGCVLKKCLLLYRFLTENKPRPLRFRWKKYLYYSLSFIKYKYNKWVNMT